MRENIFYVYMLFSGEIYTARKNFALPPVVPVVTNLISGNTFSSIFGIVYCSIFSVFLVSMTPPLAFLLSFSIPTIFLVSLSILSIFLVSCSILSIFLVFCSILSIFLVSCGIVSIFLVSCSILSIFLVSCSILSTLHILAVRLIFNTEKVHRGQIEFGQYELKCNVGSALFHEILTYLQKIKVIDIPTKIFDKIFRCVSTSTSRCPAL